MRSSRHSSVPQVLTNPEAAGLLSRAAAALGVGSAMALAEAGAGATDPTAKDPRTTATALRAAVTVLPRAALNPLDPATGRPYPCWGGPGSGSGGGGSR